MSAANLTKALRDNEKRIRQLQSEQYQITAEIESRGPLATYGYPNTSALIQDLLRVSRKEATATLARAKTLNPIQAGTNLTPAAMPIVAQAAIEGAVGDSQIDAITTALATLPSHTSDEDRISAEKILVDLAREAGPRSITRAGAEIYARLHPDGELPTEKELTQPHRELLLHRKQNGWLLLKGTLDPESGAQLQALISPLAAPRPSNDAGIDLRDAGERQGDAFAELLDLALRSNKLPTEMGELPHLVVTLDYKTLKTQIGKAHLDLAGTITASQARRLACDAHLIPTVLGPRGEPLDVGRKHRLVTGAQRRALVLRDKGCAFPECQRPPRHSQAHHIQHWADGGATNLRNLVLLCGHHHRLIHHSDWIVEMDLDELPKFIPPEWLDPQRKPRHNRPLRT